MRRARRSRDGRIIGNPGCETVSLFERPNCDIIQDANSHKGWISVSVSHQKPWMLPIDKDMNKTDLRNATGISSFAIARMIRGEDVGTAILKRICMAMKCDIGDIVEFKLDEPSSETEAQVLIRG